MRAKWLGIRRWSLRSFIITCCVIPIGIFLAHRGNEYYGRWQQIRCADIPEERRAFLQMLLRAHATDIHNPQFAKVCDELTRSEYTGIFAGIMLSQLPAQPIRSEHGIQCNITAFNTVLGSSMLVLTDDEGSVRDFVHIRAHAIERWELASDRRHLTAVVSGQGFGAVTKINVQVTQECRCEWEKVPEKVKLQKEWEKVTVPGRIHRS
ncbi:MAG: hypothetical protein H8E66_30190 [Planctomycetes bacterium]|nr:hypothetical protein [Planctomycetota bacterium]